MNPAFKSVTCLCLTFAILFAGCAGRQANPIQVYLPGDENRSCQGYMAEIAQLEADMARILPETNKFGYNTLMFAGGLFLLVPFFFMDLKDAEKVEWEAMRARRNRLVIYASERNCDFGAKGQPVPIPPLEEIRNMQHGEVTKSEELEKISNPQVVGFKIQDEGENGKTTLLPVYETEGLEFVGYQTQGTDINGKPIFVPVYE